MVLYYARTLVRIYDIASEFQRVHALHLPGGCAQHATNVTWCMILYYKLQWRSAPGILHGQHGMC